MKVYITPSTLFMPGHAQRVLAELGCGPIVTDSAGRITAHLTEQQVTLWGIKGPMHRLDVAPEVEPVAPVIEPEPKPEAPLSIIVEGPGGKREAVPISPMADPSPVRCNHGFPAGDGCLICNP